MHKEAPVYVVAGASILSQRELATAQARFTGDILLMSAQRHMPPLFDKCSILCRYRLAGGQRFERSSRQR
jgi:hypothetical protein